MVWKVCGEVVPDGLPLACEVISSDKMLEISSLVSSSRFKVRPELGMLGYV